jgi:hypothetical protein
MKSEKGLQELFHEVLKDIYFAETKILSALPKMAKAAQSPKLKAAFEKHETETDVHVARLEKVFEEIEIDESLRGKTFDAIMGIIEEGQEVMKDFKGAPALDANLLAVVNPMMKCQPVKLQLFVSRLLFAFTFGNALSRPFLFDHRAVRNFVIDVRAHLLCALDL